jgi:hypothetical protein
MALGWRWIMLVSVLTVVWPAAVARGGDGWDRQRLVHLFDFEERARGNYEDIPMYWFAIGRPADTADPNFHRQPLHSQLIRLPGYPSYADVRFDQAHRTSGQASLHLRLSGGNAGAFLQVGAIPAMPGSDYLITANVRTTVLKHAQAHLTAYLIDSRGHRIEPSVATSPPLNTAEKWQQVRVRLAGDFPQAAWIGLQVELRQPTLDPDSPLGEHQLVLQEVDGGAWFDDVAVWQLPHVQVQSQSEVNIIRAPDRPRLSMQVRDLTGRPLDATVMVYDQHRLVVDSSAKQIGGGAASAWHWTPALPRFGWYLTYLKVTEPGSSDGVPIADSLGAMLWLPDEPIIDVAASRLFGVLAPGLEQDELDLLPRLLDATRLGTSSVSVWGGDTTRSELDHRLAQLDSVLQRLLAGGRRISLSLDPAPTELARTLDAELTSPLAIFRHAHRDWAPFVAPALMRHGQRVRHWQIGSLDEVDAFYYSDLQNLLQAISMDFRNMAPQPTLVVPWKLNQSRRNDVGLPVVQYLLDVPSSVMPHHLAAHLEPWSQSPTADYQLHLRTLDARHTPHPARIDDLLLRLLHARELGGATVTLSRPWTTSQSRHPRLLPDPLLGVFSATMHRLAGRQAMGRMPLGGGLQCLIFDGPAGGMLAAWNESAAPDDAILRMYLGPQPVAIDAFSNRTPVPLVAGQHELPLQSTPVFIEGIDSRLALFRASFALDEPFIESIQVPHVRTISLSNPWDRTISGHMLLTGPPGWQLSPQRHHFSIAAGQTSQMTVQMMFPVSEVAGPKHLTARFEFIASSRYQVDLATPMTLGLPNVSFDATIALERDPQTGRHDAVVTQLITNTGLQDLALSAFATMRGHPRQERVIAQLQPGQSIVRRFRFADAAEQFQTTDIRVGVRETAGPAVLNQILRAEDLLNSDRLQ